MSLLSRWKKPLIRSKVFSGLARYPRYIGDIFRYRRMDGAESIRFRDTYPCLFDRTSKTRIDSHYFYQAVWAARRISSAGPEIHVDVGSDVDFVGILTAITQVHFVDIRPLEVSNIPNLNCVEGTILSLPYEDDCLQSISCLHVAEHIGLGRYGDPLNPHGTMEAARELSRCLARGGRLYFSLPVGIPRLCFNAHRIHSPQQIIEYFSDLTLLEMSGTTDRKEFLEDIKPEVLEGQKFACGMFCFTKE